jgi:hypothetical protein
VSLSDLEYILDRLDQSVQTPVPFYVVRDNETRVGQLNLLRR